MRLLRLVIVAPCGGAPPAGAQVHVLLRGPGAHLPLDSRYGLVQRALQPPWVAEAEGAAGTPHHGATGRTGATRPTRATGRDRPHRARLCRLRPQPLRKRSRLPAFATRLVKNSPSGLCHEIR